MQSKLKLVVFDFDGVLAQGSQLLGLASAAGKQDAIGAIVKEALTSLDGAPAAHRQCVQLLAGLPLSDVDIVGRTMSPMKGALETISHLRKLGIEVAVITNGYTQTCQPLLSRLAIHSDYVIANTLHSDGEFLTGTFDEASIDHLSKQREIVSLMDRIAVTRQQTAAVGDDLNDWPMLQATDSPVGFMPSPGLDEKLTTVVRSGDLSDIIKVLGLPV